VETEVERVASEEQEMSRIRAEAKAGKEPGHKHGRGQN
jgi:hypothetical protein